MVSREHPDIRRGGDATVADDPLAQTLPAEKKAPRASLVILTKNGGPRFRTVIERIQAQVVPFDYEVLVVDSGSTDGSDEAAVAAGWRVIRIPPTDFRFGPTRDFAFSHAHGDLIVTISQDVVPLSDNWLEVMCRPFEKEGADAVQMWAVLPEPVTFFWEKAGLFYYTREIRRWLRQYGIGLSCHCLAVRREVWQRYGFGEALMSEDKVLQARMAQGNCKVVVVPELMVEHYLEHGVIRLAKRCMNEGMGWRFVDVRYSLRDAILDLASPRIWRCYVLGLLRLQMRRPSEFLYPFLRPTCLWIGNRFIGGYVR
ncbi:MAG TPA: glycosyltransferase family 2 protein [Dehalococcoidia bacterium]|nr:glycosyltransferase family 2 protein [Dehalococcoidia bacterium]